MSQKSPECEAHALSDDVVTMLDKGKQNVVPLVTGTTADDSSYACFLSVMRNSYSCILHAICRDYDRLRALWRVFGILERKQGGSQ